MIPNKKLPQRKFRLLKKRIILLFLAVACFTAGVLCVMILMFSKHPVLMSPLQADTGKSTRIMQNTQLVNDVKKFLNDEHISYEKVEIIENRTVYIKLAQGEEILVTPEKDILNQIRSLQLTINHFTIEGKKISRVDFRFEKPVITLK